MSTKGHHLWANREHPKGMLGKHHSEEAKRAIGSKNGEPKIKHSCAVCGKEFYDYASSNRKFCSLPCAYSPDGRIVNRGSKKVFPESTCLQCGKVFEQKRPGQKLCSRSCCGKRAGLAAAGTVKPFPKEKRIGSYISCAGCGKEFYAAPSVIKQGRRFCSATCARPFVVAAAAKANRINGHYDSRNAYSACKYGWRTIAGKNYFFRSAWESNYARYLESRKELGEITGWEYEPKTFAISCGTYTPDFMVNFPDRVEWHEVKGFRNPKTVAKFDELKATMPELNLTMIGERWFYDAAKSGLADSVTGWEFHRNETRGRNRNRNKQPVFIA